MTVPNSYHHILKTSAISASATLVTLFLTFLRMKVAAVILGPAGVGLLALYQNLISTAASVGGMGLGTVGTRAIASAHDSQAGGDIPQTVAGLFYLTVFFAAVSPIVILLASTQVAVLVFHDAGQSSVVAWLSVGVTTSILATLPSAVLSGERQITTLAIVQVISGLLASALAIASIGFFGAQGLIAFVLSGSVTTLCVSAWFIRNRLIEAITEGARTSLPPRFRQMTALGVFFMLAAMMPQLALFMANKLIQTNLGLEELGFYQAAWTIGTGYIAIVLGAMTTDFFPRLSGVINDRQLVNGLVNEQTEVALLILGPLLLALMGSSSVVVQYFYTNEFAPAATVLRLHLLGDVLKVMSWPLGFMLLASGSAKTFLLTELTCNGVYVLVMAIGVSTGEFFGSGFAFVALYFTYLPLVWVIASRRTGFRWSSSVLHRAIALFISVCAVGALSLLSEVLSASVGVVLAIGFALSAYFLFSKRTKSTVSGQE